jgi:hypothetical protein
MVILGGPGAGKTTTLSYALLMFIQQRAKEKFNITQKLLPIFIPLRRLPNNGNSIVEDLYDKNTRILSSDILAECPKKYFERKLKKGQCLVLLDGLDEVIDERAHRRVIEKINNLVADYPDNRYVVTCRIAGWKGELFGDFTVLTAQNFNREEIQRFVTGWHRAVITQAEHIRKQREVPDPNKFKEIWAPHVDKVVMPAVDFQSRKLIKAIEDNNRILQIAVNPMLLSLICLVHYSRNILPRGRTILYSQCIDLLVDAWEREKDITDIGNNGLDLDHKEAIVRGIAFNFQQHGKGEETRANLEEIIEKLSQSLSISVSPKEILSDIEQRSGLLVEKSIDVLGFSHLTLQEYLVAKHIQLNTDKYWLLTDNLDKQEWREVILLYAGAMDDATRLVRDISPIDSLDRKILAGYCIGDAKRCDKEVSGPVVDYLVAALNSPRLTEEVVDVLATIAADYIDNPVSVEEQLSQYLIDIINKNKTVEEHERLCAIRILGKARVQKAVPSLINLTFDSSESEIVRVTSVEALVFYGNYAIDSLNSFINAHIEEEYQLKGMENGIFGYFRWLEPIIKVLWGINTGQSARILIKFYGLQNWNVDILISTYLIRMLSNSFVEADLLELEVNQLPPAICSLKPWNDNWPYPRHTAKNGFILLYQKLIRDISVLMENNVSVEKLNFDADKPESFRIDGNFKVLFPALLKCIKFPSGDAPLLPAKKENVSFIKNLNLVGFDEIEKNALEIGDIIEAIHLKPSMTIEYALQNSSFATNKDEFKEEKVVSWQSSSIIYLLIYDVFILITTPYMFISSLIAEASLYERIYFIVGSGLSLALLIGSGLVLAKKQRTYSKFNYIFPIIGFLDILPYITKLPVKIKLAALYIVILCISPLLLSLFFIRIKQYSGDITLIPVTLYLAFLSFSIIFLKKVVLADNPILRLMLLHPKGREVIENS